MKNYRSFRALNNTLEPKYFDSTESNEIIQILKNGYVRFTPFGPAGQAIYDQISAESGIDGGIRTMYNTSNTGILNIIYTNIKTFPVQAGSYNGQSFTSEDVQYVIDVLQPEVFYAINVSELFTHLEEIFIDLFTIQDATLTDIVDAVGLQDTPAQSVNMIIANIVIGIATTLISEIPVVGGLVSGLIQTTVSAVEAGMSWSGPQPPDELSCKVSELQDQLIANFKLLANNLGDIQEKVTSNLGMMNSISDLMVSKGSSSPFNWNASIDSEIVSAGQSGYEIEIIKILLPINYSIYFAYRNAANNGEFIYIDGYFVQSDGTYGYEYSSKSLSFGTFTPYYLSNQSINYEGTSYQKCFWIADKSNAEQYLDSSVLWNILNNSLDVFTGLNNWILILCPYHYFNSLNVRVCNNSNFTFSISGSESNAVSSATTLGGVLNPGESIDFFMVRFPDGLNDYLPIVFDSNFSCPNPQDPSSVLNHLFKIELPVSMLGSNDISILVKTGSSNLVSMDPYTHGSDRHNYGGGALLNLYNNPSLEGE